VACGMALADKENYTYVLMGDGECNEGSVWESILFAAKHRLRNIVLIIDKNDICATDFLENVCPLQNVGDAMRKLGWSVAEVDGHDLDVMIDLIGKLKRWYCDMPVAIIANTTKGKGISYMENNPKWHHGVPSEKQLEQARREINGS